MCEDGQILENKKAFFCTSWREGCKFTIWKNTLESYGLEVTQDMVEELLKNKELKNVYIKKLMQKKKIILYYLFYIFHHNNVQ